MKRLNFFILFLVLGTNLFCFDGVLSGENKLYVLKTQWFDIIYPETSQESAGILYSKADSVYKEITESYGITPQFRMPVVLTPQVENSNAYWSSYPYNHIVIYDTGEIEALNVFSENLISTFRHELTHAVSYNMRSPFLQKVDEILGDPINPVQLTITRGWAEGATLSSESSFGEGRLNDEFSKHSVKQAKIQGEFPDYSDVQGASDIYPMGSFYNFNGAFDFWLQHKYGMEKYAKFWYICVNLQALTAKGAFYKAYGLNLYETWKEFVAEIEIPQLVESNAEDLVNNNSGAVYSNLSAGKNGIVFMDDKCGTVYFISANQLNQKTEKLQKLFYSSELNGIKLSDDGRFLLVDQLSEKTATQKKSISIYSMEKKNWFSLKETGLKDGAIIKNEDNYYLVCQNFVSQKLSIKIYKLIYNSKAGNFSDYIEVSNTEFPVNVIPYSFVDLGKGKFACIKKSRMDYSICVYDLQGNQLQEYKAPKEKMVIRYLSYNGKEILFSWTTTGTLPRLGKLTLSENGNGMEGEGQFALQSQDFSGGVFWPVSLNGEINYIGSFFRQNKLFTGSILCDEFIKTENSFESGNFASQTEENQNLFAETVSHKHLQEIREEYKPFDYYTKGCLLPISQITSESHKPGSEISSNLPFGVTYITSNPWTTGMLELAAGYGVRTNSVAAGVTYSSGTDTSLFSYAISSTSEFDSHFWKQSKASASVGSTIPFGLQSYLGISESASIYYGRSNLQVADSEELANTIITVEDFTKYLYGENALSVTYSNIHKAGPGRYEKTGGRVTGAFVYTYNSKGILNPEVYYNGGNLVFASEYYIPKLIPVVNPFRYTINLPTRINMNLFCTTGKTYSFIENVLSIDITNANSHKVPVFNAASIQTETVLFAYDIQKTVPGVRAVFANDFYVSLGYAGGFSVPEDLRKDTWRIFNIEEYYNRILDNSMPYSGYVSLKTKIGISPNFGGLASYLNKMYLYAQAIVTQESQIFFDFGIDVAF